MFKECGGIELLCELFEKFKTLTIAKALAHVIYPRDSNTNSFIVPHIHVLISFLRFI